MAKTIFFKYGNTLINLAGVFRIFQSSNVLVFVFKYKEYKVEYSTVSEADAGWDDLEAALYEDPTWFTLGGQKFNLGNISSVIKATDTTLDIYSDNNIHTERYASIAARNTSYTSIKTAVLALSESLWKEASTLDRLINMNYVYLLEKLQGNAIRYTIGDNVETILPFVSENARDAEFVASDALTSSTQERGPEPQDLMLVAANGPFVGEDLEVSFTFADEESDVIDQEFIQWYRSDDVIGTNREAIDGETASTYTLVSGDLGKFISAEVYATAETGRLEGRKFETDKLGIISLTVTPLTPFNEANFLEGILVDIEVVGDTFKSDIVAADISLANFPTGIEVSEIVHKNRRKLRVRIGADEDMKYDFDANITTGNIVIAGEAMTAGYETTSANLTLTASTESAALAVDVAMTQANLNARILTITLTNETFKDVSFINANFVLENEPTGVTISSVSRLSSTQARVVLAAGTVTDFDANITNFHVTISGDVLSRGTDLVTSNLTITAIVESLTATPSVALTEANLNGATIDLLIVNDTLADNSIQNGNIVLNNAPTGLVINNAEVQSDTTIRLTLGFNNTDFDANITNFNITLAGAELRSGGALTSNNMTITAVVE